MNSPVTMNFTLPPSTEVKVRSSIAWVNAQEQRIGVRFDPADGHRLRVKAWVEEYLGL